MNQSRHIEPDSKQFVTRLRIAIDEARLAQLALKSNNTIKKPEPHELVSRKLLLINREIELLEAKLEKVRCQAN